MHQCSHISFFYSTSFCGVFKKSKSKNPFPFIRVVDKTKVRTRNIKIDVRERNGNGSDQVINTSSGGQIVIKNLDDYRQVDQLVI